jgi:hypothetical protein
VVPRSRCRSLPEIIIIESRMDANAINHSKQKKEKREPGGRRISTCVRVNRRAGASRAASSGGGVLSRHVCSAQMPAGSLRCSLAVPPAGWIFADAIEIADETVEYHTTFLPGFN